MKRSTISFAFLVLSMPLVIVAVKAQDRAAASDLKDSVKGEQNELSKLVQTVMASGKDGKFVNGHAQAAGLAGPMPIKSAAVALSDGARRCRIVYESDEAAGNRPYCIYFMRSKIAKHEGEERYYRVSLDGRLEKVVTLKNKIDDDGKVLREGRSKVEEDMASPAVKKAFKAEMAFWLKDWLKKQPKLAAPH